MINRGHVAIVIPTLNEQQHIGGLLERLGRQSPNDVAQIIVVDGGSSDETRSIVLKAAEGDSRVQLLPNPDRIQAAGVNLAAISAAPGVSLLIRADAHARYPADFVETLLAAHLATGAQSVVNRLRSEGYGCFQKAVAAIGNSHFGTGGSAHRIGSNSHYVDHGHHALFDRSWFLRTVGYDREFFANEDAEYDARLRAAGGKIWLASESCVTYYPRSTPSALASQYFRYGMGRAMTMLKHGERPRLRQIIPPIMVFALLLGIMGSIADLRALAIPLLYMAGVLAASTRLMLQSKTGCVGGAVIALPIVHISWGCGFILMMIIARGSYANLSAQRAQVRSEPQPSVRSAQGVR